MRGTHRAVSATCKDWNKTATVLWDGVVKEVKNVFSWAGGTVMLDQWNDV